MAYKFRTINAPIPSNHVEYESDIHTVHIKFPLDDYSIDKLRKVSMYKSFIHELIVECTDDSQSVYDIFTSTIPIGCDVQTITVRYNKASRACVDIGNLSGKVESVHVISSSVNDQDVQKCKLLDCLTIRLSGFVPECSMIDLSNSCTVGGDYIQFVPNINMNNTLSTEKRLSESECVDFIMR